MIKIKGSSETRPNAKTAKTKAASGAFSPNTVSAGSVEKTDSAPRSDPAPMLGALLALQGDGDGSAKTYAAAQRTLEILEEIQRRLLDGVVATGDLEALRAAARARARADADPGLLELYDQIALRARVELAKLGE